MNTSLNNYKLNLIKIYKAFLEKSANGWYQKEIEAYKQMIPLITQENFDIYIQLLEDYDNSKKYVLEEYLKKGITSFVFWNFTYYIAEGTNIKGWFGLIEYRLSKINYPNTKLIAEIQGAIENKEEIRVSWVGKFDYSVSVKPDGGFYNREYHGCGNGYYYILLNAKEALFVERD